jgi:hypothetical protein
MNTNKPNFMMPIELLEKRLLGGKSMTDEKFVIIPRELAENFLYSTEVPRFKRILSSALAQREQGAPSLCTAEEAAELARELRLISIEGELHGTLVLSTEQLAAIINADRAKR